MLLKKRYGENFLWSPHLCDLFFYMKWFMKLKDFWKRICARCGFVCNVKRFSQTSFFPSLCFRKYRINVFIKLNLLCVIGLIYHFFSLLLLPIVISNDIGTLIYQFSKSRAIFQKFHFYVIEKLVSLKIYHRL